MWCGEIAMTWLRAALAIVLYAAILLAGSGCTGKTRRSVTTAQLSPTAAQRAELGLVAVTADLDRTVEIEISGRPPSRTATTLLGATAGAGLPVMVGLGVGIAAGPFAPFVIAAGVILAPAGLVVGTVHGLSAPGATAWDEQERATRPTLAPPTIHDLLRDRVIAMASTRTQQPVGTVPVRDADARARPPDSGGRRRGALCQRVRLFRPAAPRARRLGGQQRPAIAAGAGSLLRGRGGEDRRGPVSGGSACPCDRRGTVGCRSARDRQTDDGPGTRLAPRPWLVAGGRPDSVPVHAVRRGETIHGVSAHRPVVRSPGSNPRPQRPRDWSRRCTVPARCYIRIP
jgi:hypothetical protein